MIKKFRAWDEDNKRFIYAVLNGPFMDCSLNPDGLDGTEDGTELTDLKLGPWQQSTGMFDAAAKEIYEGDVVKKGARRSYLVEYNPGPESWWLPYWENEEDYVIVGNINQNPELKPDVIN